MPYGQDGEYKILTFKDNQNKITDREMNNKISEYSTMRNSTENEIKNTITNQLKNNLINNIQNNNFQ